MTQRYALLGLGGLLLSGCSVYTPMLGAAPEIRGKGELEATAGWSLTNRFDVGATYSPVRHVLVRAAASTKGGDRSAAAGDSSNYSQNNQYELAVGTYWPLGAHWLVGGLAGFGQAHSQARYAYDGSTLLSFREPARHQFDAIYSKYFGEAYATWQPTPTLSLGLAYRVVQVRLTDVTDFGAPVQAAPILRFEPMLFCRVRPWFTNDLLQVQFAAGGSGTFGYNERTAADYTDPARQFKLSRSYVSVGLAFYPHLLWQKK